MDKKINEILKQYGKQNSEYTTVINMSNEKTKVFSKTMLIWFPMIIITALILVKIGTICYENGLDISSSIFELIAVILFTIEIYIISSKISKKEYLNKLFILIVEEKLIHLYSLKNKIQYEINESNIKNVVFDDAFNSDIKESKDGFERLNGHILKISLKDGTTLELGFAIGQDSSDMDKKCINEFYNIVKNYELDWNIKK